MSGRAKSQSKEPAAPSYVVVGILADGRNEHGQVVTMHRGSPVLPSITSESIAHLLSVGLIAEVQP